MARRVLVVNPNTSPEVTEAYLAAARAVAPDDVVLTGVTGRFGARIVTIEAENIIAGHSALDLVAEHVGGHDAVILAISFDTGLAALRSVLGVPVVGISEAALQVASAGGRRPGVVFFGEISRTLYASVLERNGIVPAGMVAIEIGGASDYLSPEAKDAAVLDASLRLAAEGAEAVVIFGAAIVGMAARIEARSSVPIFDGVEAVAACLGAMASHRPRPAVRPLSESVGLSPSLTRLLNGDLR
ncbi:allantoin racemase [Roseivivax lentus]|uniref:Allantoin racemase n=1 Tax=Roseivivax lentus TaxID=633194 RepID=A0A1N7NTJ6_9RHOB|nr:aspartate/glutamate racemase family protein [Roseivivax lentus]SIT01664.1 allantoin racemase [Roseivivax lentus]